MERDVKEFVWAQKYRPQSVEECVLPAATKAMAQALVKKGEIPNMIFSGGPGMGKTTLAFALAKDIGCDSMYINASVDNGIDTLRYKIQTFASTMSLEGDDKPKIVILDEADGLTPAMQAGLKSFIESFSENCRFIFTANNKHKLIEPIHSRCNHIDFTLNPADKPAIASAIMKRCVDILDMESVKYDKAAVAALVKKTFPDFRRTLNDLQRYSVGGVIDSGVLDLKGESNIRQLFNLIKEKKIAEMRKWVSMNEDIDPATLFRTMYDLSAEFMTPLGQAALILIVADYQYKAAFVADQQVNTMACLVEVARDCQFAASVSK
jgi:replication factor C small subunit